MNQQVFHEANRLRRDQFILAAYQMFAVTAYVPNVISIVHYMNDNGFTGRNSSDTNWGLGGKTVQCT